MNFGTRLIALAAAALLLLSLLLSSSVEQPSPASVDPEPADPVVPVFFPASPPPRTHDDKRLLRVSVLAIFKNEAGAIREWIEHYLWQGFDTLLLLDNGSTDNSADIAKTTAAELNRTADVLILPAPGINRQAAHYNSALLRLRSLSDIALIVDLDEFLYSTDTAPAADHIRTHFTHPIAQLTFPMLRFGSSGHIKQPPSIRTGFIHRKLESAEDAHYGNRKSAVRLSSVLLFVVHVHQVLGDTLNLESKETPLRLNHYRIQSREWFGKVKMGRGDVNGMDHSQGPGVRDWKYFEKHDYKEVKDTGLRDKVEELERDKQG
jgi:glycosyltransferase involved in cell wall biosynthesis